VTAKRPAAVHYTVKRTTHVPELPDFDSRVWSQAEAAPVDCARPESSDHHPATEARLLYDRTAIYGRFTVQDRYVRCVHTEYQAMVCEDSCVEFFVKPRDNAGYINLEINCGGTMHMSCIVDHHRVPGGFADYSPVPEHIGSAVQVAHSLPAVVDPERTEPTPWRVAFSLPLSVLEEFVGPLGDPAGRQWRGNFYKCGDRTSHPHWLSWSPVSELNFHLPECFGTLYFDPS
jgi:hypothetical protein